MAQFPDRTLLPIIPLARDAVLIPGFTLHIPLHRRPDVAALLSAAYTQAAQQNAKPSATLIGCVPLCSPLLSPEGQRLLEDSDARVRKTAQRLVDDPNNAHEEELFAYGAMAKVAGVQGRRPRELVLVVEGLRRFRMERFTQFKPYIECEATPLGEESECGPRNFALVANSTVIGDDDSHAQGLFQQMKQLSRELLTLVRLSSLLPQSTAILSPALARRLEVFIMKKGIEEAGALADFMTNVVQCTFEEKLQGLAAWEISTRLELVIEILSHQIDGIKGSVKVTSITSTSLPAGLDITNLPQLQREACYNGAV